MTDTDNEIAARFDEAFEHTVTKTDLEFENEFPQFEDLTSFDKATYAGICYMIDHRMDDDSLQEMFFDCESTDAFFFDGKNILTTMGLDVNANNLRVLFESTEKMAQMWCWIEHADSDGLTTRTGGSLLALSTVFTTNFEELYIKVRVPIHCWELANAFSTVGLGAGGRG